MPQNEAMTLPPRLPLVIKLKNRPNSYTKDSRLINCYLETDENQDLYIIKRPGTEVVDGLAVTAAEGRGIFYWQGHLYAIFGDSLYIDGTLEDNTLDDAGFYSFNSILGATPKLVFGNGTKTYAYDSVGGVSADLHSIDVDYPEFTLPGIVYLNGATYVGQADTDKIWNSAINSVSNPGDWGPLNFIAAQGEPDNLVALAKQVLYVVSLGEWSLEVFFDAGNPQGTPLGVVQGAKVSYGCFDGRSVQLIDDKLFWLSATRSAQLQISMLDNLTHSVISTPDIDRLLASSDTGTVYSWQVKFGGHTFYVITLVNVNLTLAYDIEQNLWYLWTDAEGNYLPFVSSAYLGDDNLLQHESDGNIYRMSSSLLLDAQNPIVVDIYTPRFDANTTRKKTLSMMKFVADRVSNSLLAVRYSDDDSSTWSNFRYVDLGMAVPYLQNCGTFKRRSYHFRHNSPTNFRIQAVDVQYDLGTL